MKAEITFTEYGERMALSLYLPHKYNFDLGDGNSMALRLECLNSVDGSTRFRALMGWFRFVCSNGLVVGVTRSDMIRRHIGDLRIEDVCTVLTSGLSEYETEKKNFETWHMEPITLERLIPWTEDTIEKAWGFKAATRAFHIAKTGEDVEIVGSYKDTTPTTIAVNKTKRVPGTPRKGANNLYDVSQVLAWLAKERRDIQEQLEWREKIPELMKPLMN